MGELKALFPHNAVEYFISYHGYYLPDYDYCLPEVAAS